MFAHVIACAFVMVGTDPTGFPNQSWIVKTNSKVLMHQFSLATLTTVGYVLRCDDNRESVFHVHSNCGCSFERCDHGFRMDERMHDEMD